MQTSMIRQIFKFSSKQIIFSIFSGKMSSIKESLLTEVAETLPSAGNKVTVVGIGQVGMACAFSILAQGVSNELCLVDCMADKLTGEMMDLQHGSNFLKSPKITSGTGRQFKFLTKQDLYH